MGVGESHAAFREGIDGRRSHLAAFGLIATDIPPTKIVRQDNNNVRQTFRLIALRLRRGRLQRDAEYEGEDGGNSLQHRFRLHGFTRFGNLAEHIDDRAFSPDCRAGAPSDQLSRLRRRSLLVVQ